MKKFLPSLAGLALLAMAPAFAPAAAEPPQPPIGVTAESLVVEEGGALIRFEGKVVLKRGTLTLTCDKLLLRAAGGDPSRVQTGDAEGSVVIVREGDRAEAAKAAFDLLAGRVVLTGKPSLLRGSDTIRGSQITYTLSDGKAAFAGPVEATFTPTGALATPPAPPSGPGAPR